MSEKVFHHNVKWGSPDESVLNAFVDDEVKRLDEMRERLIAREEAGETLTDAEKAEVEFCGYFAMSMCSALRDICER